MSMQLAQNVPSVVASRTAWKSRPSPSTSSLALSRSLFFSSTMISKR